MKKIQKVILTFSVLVLFVGIAFTINILRPLSVFEVSIKVEDFTYKPSFESYRRQYYEDSQSISFKNEDCTFSSQDMTDYCIVDVVV